MGDWGLLGSRASGLSRIARSFSTRPPLERKMCTSTPELPRFMKTSPSSWTGQGGSSIASKH